MSNMVSTLSDFYAEGYGMRARKSFLPSKAYVTYKLVQTERLTFLETISVILSLTKYHK